MSSVIQVAERVTNQPLQRLNPHTTALQLQFLSFSRKNDLVESPVSPLKTGTLYNYTPNFRLKSHFAEQETSVIHFVDSSGFLLPLLNNSNNGRAAVAAVAILAARQGEQGRDTNLIS